jgi:calmodulin
MSEDLRRAFDFIDKKKDGVIDEDDLNQVFMSLGHKTKKGEIADMIWEVDEDCDNALNWKVKDACIQLLPAQTSTLTVQHAQLAISPMA